MPQDYKITCFFCCHNACNLCCTKDIALFDFVCKDCLQRILFHKNTSLCHSLAFCYLLGSYINHTRLSFFIYMGEFWHKILQVKVEIEVKVKKSFSHP